MTVKLYELGYLSQMKALLEEKVKDELSFLTEMLSLDGCRQGRLIHLPYGIVKKNLFSKKVNFILDMLYRRAIIGLEVKNMGTISFAVKLSEETRKRLKEFCDERGLKIGHFVEEALKEKMEREEMIEDAKEFALYRHEEPHAIEFKDYLRERSSRGKKRASV
ncbi:MAG: hypothetical protein ACE5JU_06680 [Candidatus Binatia bacterium]